jgi:hypothetical protein
MINEQPNSSVVNRDFKLKIKTLQNAARDAAKAAIGSKAKTKGTSYAH